MFDGKPHKVSIQSTHAPVMTSKCPAKLLTCVYGPQGCPEEFSFEGQTWQAGQRKTPSRHGTHCMRPHLGHPGRARPFAIAMTFRMHWPLH